MIKTATALFLSLLVGPVLSSAARRRHAIASLTPFHLDQRKVR